MKIKVYQHLLKILSDGQIWSFLNKTWTSFKLEKWACLIRLYNPLEGINNPKYKLFHFWTIIFFNKGKRELAFNRDRWCHLALCLQLILLHYYALVIFLNCKTDGLKVKKWVQTIFRLLIGLILRSMYFGFVVKLNWIDNLKW